MGNRVRDEGSIIHLRFVTEGLNKTIEWLSDLRGAPTDPERLVAPDESAIYIASQGHSAGRQIRFLDFGNIEFEIIQTGASPSVWRRPLAGPGALIELLEFDNDRGPRPGALGAGDRGSQLWV